METGKLYSQVEAPDIALEGSDSKIVITKEYGDLYYLGGGSGTDTKVLADASDTTAGHLLEKIEAGTNISITLDDITDPVNHKLVIASTGSASGEANTTSNAGSTGLGLALAKSGVNLPFKRINAGANITITDETDYIEISAVGGGGSGQWYDDGGFIKNLGDKPVIITGTGSITANYDITGTGSDYDDSYTDSGTLSDTNGYDPVGQPIYIGDTNGKRMIIDNANHWWCLDSLTGTVPPVYSSADFVNHGNHTILGTFTKEQSVGVGDGTATVGSGGITGEALEVFGSVKVHDGILFESKALMTWSDTNDYFQTNIDSPAAGAAYVWKADGTARLAIPVTGAGNATQMYRSTLFGGYRIGYENSNNDISISTLLGSGGTEEFFDSTFIDCDTGLSGDTAKPDVGIGGALQVIDGILVGSRQSSGNRVEILPTGVFKNGVEYGTGSGGGVVSITGGANITVDSSDAANPEVSLTDLTGYDVIDLDDVTDAGSGIIISDAERISWNAKMDKVTPAPTLNDLAALDTGGNVIVSPTQVNDVGNTTSDLWSASQIISYTAPDNGDNNNRPLGFPTTGTQYFSTDLGYPIWFNGANWVTSAGAYVLPPRS